MTKEQSNFTNSVTKNRLRRLINYVNWRHHRSDLVTRLIKITEKINAKEFLIAVYADSAKTKPYVEGNDSIAVRIAMQPTWIHYHENETITNDYETGATLIISHSDAGFNTVFINPAKSKQSGADHKVIIAYHDMYGVKISDKKLNRLIDSLCLYHMYTSVLFENSVLLRFKILVLKAKDFYYRYLDGDNKFKYAAGIYIPLASLVISLIALVVAFIFSSP
ncbi:hypothetical protein [Aeromonas salmonicida]|uniref:hypothetical protein n=1 Tax=Aeromonas salmonicida TaxID=645 RepID=UPI0038BDFD90